MRPSSLLRHAVHITLFSRDGCALCHDAKLVLSKVWDKRPFAYTEVDVMTPGQKCWKDVYEFDVPVVHVERSVPGTSAAVRKLMHRFAEDQVERLMDDAERDHSRAQKGMDAISLSGLEKP